MMSEASVISTQDYGTEDECVRVITECLTSNSLRSTSTTTNQYLESNERSNIKENQELNYIHNGGKYSEIQSKIVDENDLKDLLLAIKDRQSKLNQDNMPKEHNYKEWDQYYSFPRLYLPNNSNENQFDPFILQPSLFHKNHVPPTIYFSTKLDEDSRPPIGIPKSLQNHFKWKISSITPNSIRSCIAFMKFEIIKPTNQTDNLYLGSWCKHMLTVEFAQLEEWRKVNHYPGSFHLGRKDKLWFRLRLANQKFGNDKFADFHPTTFVLPRDYEDLCEYWSHSPSKLFIMKPPASARGNGIKVINDISQIPPKALKVQEQSLDDTPIKKSTMIVQQYISNPCLLENGQKFDLRIYVLLTSVDPLRIYVYDEGIVRFASSKYTSQEDGIIDQYMHLTNYFINKNNQEYQINNDCDSLNGCKWTLKRFWRYLDEHYTHIDAQKLWDKIKEIIVQTIICCEGPMTRLSHQNCKNDYTSFELFGFDIILDENFKPWILEVNITPSLKSESDLDTKVKYGVIKDMFNTVGYNLPTVKTEDLTKLKKLRDHRLFFDRRLYMENLTKRDKLKQTKYQKVFKMLTEHRRSHLDKKSTGNLDQDIDKSDSQSSQVPKAEEQKSVGKESNKNVTNESCNLSDSGKTSDDDLNTMKMSVDSILNELTQNDIRVLMLAEDELSRCGHFKRVFPTATSGKYLTYFDKPRYYNLLLDAWERRYKDNRLEGINHLSSMATFLDVPVMNE